MTFMPEGNVQHLWYTKRDGKISGPHPLKQIQRFIILGRINNQDELSMDRVSWKQLHDFPEIIPEISRGQDPKNNHRLMAARMREDERRFGDRRKQHQGIDAERRKKDRRQPESATIIEYRKFKHDMIREKSKLERKRRMDMYMVIFSVITVVVGAGVFLTLYSGESAKGSRFSQACKSLPKAGVDWTNCNLPRQKLRKLNLSQARMRSANLAGSDFSGAVLSNSDLSYANLSVADLSASKLAGAVMVGVTLYNADLSGSILDGADLSYANLTQANLNKASLKNVRLDHAIWVDQRICDVGSIGTCKRQREVLKK